MSIASCRGLTQNKRRVIQWQKRRADDIIKQIKDEDVEYVDIRFCDLPGVVQHFSIPASAFDESVFEDGLAFDGSSVRGFQSIHESDMMLLPDPDDRAASTRSAPPRR